MSVFIAGNYFCVVNKNLAELPERYMYRGYTIAKQQVMTEETYQQNVLLSNYNSNMVFLNCMYSDEITKQCQIFKQ
jgi:hypothetical protein